MAKSQWQKMRGLLTPRANVPGSGEEHRSRPLLLSLRSHETFILGTVSLAIFTDIFLYGLIVPVMPYSLTAQAGVAEDQVQQWTAILLACYSVALFVGSPLAGFWADRTESRRGPLLLGLLALAASTLMLCLGRSVAVLAVGRVLQGLSAAVVWSVGLALLADTMGREIGLSMGYVNIATSGGLLVSPLIGGVVYGAAGYYSVFYVAFGLIFIDIVLRLLLVEKRTAARWIVNDNPLRDSSPVGRGAAPESQGPQPPSSTKTAAPRGGGDPERHSKTEPGDVSGTSAVSGEEAKTGTQGRPVPGGSAPLASRPRALHPNLELIKSKRMLAALGGATMQSAVMFAFDTVVPLFVKDTFQWDSTAAGLIFLAIFIPGFASPLIGKLADRHGAKWPSLVGFVASIPLLVCMRLVTSNTVGHKALLTVLLTTLGLTLTLSITPLMAEITYAIEDEEAARPGVWGDKSVFGAGYGLYTTAFALGGTAGSLMAGYVVAGPGWGTFTWSISLWCVAGGGITLCWVGGKGLRSKGAGDGPAPQR